MDVFVVDLLDVTSYVNVRGLLSFAEITVDSYQCKPYLTLFCFFLSPGLMKLNA